MIRDLEDKAYRGDADRDRHEGRMGRYRAAARRGGDVAPAPPPFHHVHVETAAQPRCDVFRVDTGGVR